MNFKRRKRSSVDINLIPMIDVLLVLLIFFVLTTTFSKQTQLKINLPEASSSETAPQTDMLTVFVDAKGQYAIADQNGKPKRLVNQELTTLKETLQQLAGDSRQMPFVISADGKAPHQSVINVLDIARQLGFTHLTFATQTPEKT